MARKVDVSTGLIVVGAVALLVALFLNWYTPDMSAWDSFEALDLVLCGLALLVGATAAGRLDAALPGARRALPVLVGVTFVIVSTQILDPPPAVATSDLCAGAWIALVASVLMVIGAGMAIARVSVVLDVRDRETRRRGATRPAARDADDETTTSADPDRTRRMSRRDED